VHYTFLGQPYRITDDPSSSDVRAPSPVGSNGSCDYGEDPDDTMLAFFDLQQVNIKLQAQIDTMQQQINDLEEQAGTADLHNTSLSSSFERARERIMYLESRLHAADRKISTPVRHNHTTPQSTPWRYKETRSQTPSGSPKRAPQTPRTPSSCRRQVQLFSSTPTVSHSLQTFEDPPASGTPQASPSMFCTAHGSASVSGCGPLLPQYIILFNLQHLATSLDLIRNYTPERNRVQELIKLGLDEDRCDALAEAMALDNGIQLSEVGSSW
jgi:hypothetical protein